MIELDEFRKVYAGTVAVDGLSLSVQSGQILGLIGPNGAGKTTTMRAMCGLVTPTSGKISVDGIDVEHDPIAVKTRLAYLPDEPPLFPELTVEQHLAFTAAVFRISDAEDKGKQLLRRFEIDGKRGNRPSELSRGMKQKLAICCAYLHDPKYLLLDEPMTGLDPHGIRTLKETIRERAADGTTVVVSSHLLAMVEDICTHVLILKQGHVRFSGPIDDLKASYLSTQDQATLEQIFFHATADAPAVESQANAGQLLESST
ncbi:MAG: ABC transporter ATP-binding protein [Planctomycetaceae bacterium]|nr:ABC transporter ATP-binding protein [Planctomycetaceae bacterium]